MTHECFGAPFYWGPEKVKPLHIARNGSRLRAPGVGCQASARPEYPRRATSPHHARTFAEAAELVFTSPLPEGKVVRFSKELAYYGAHSTLPHMPPTLSLTTCIHLPCNMQPFRTRWTSCSELATPTFNTRSLFATQPRLYGHSIEFERVHAPKVWPRV